MIVSDKVRSNAIDDQGRIWYITMRVREARGGGVNFINGNLGLRCRNKERRVERPADDLGGIIKGKCWYSIIVNADHVKQWRGKWTMLETRIGLTLNGTRQVSKSQDRWTNVSFLSFFWIKFK
jgi:hypothetical protein